VFALPCDLYNTRGGAHEIAKLASGTGITLHICEITPEGNEYIGVVISSGTYRKAAKALRYSKQDTFLTDSVFTSTSPVELLGDNGAGIWWAINSRKWHGGEVPGFYDEKRIYYSTQDSDKEIAFLEGYHLGDGGEGWEKEFSMERGSTNIPHIVEESVSDSLTESKYLQREHERIVYFLTPNNLVAISTGTKITFSGFGGSNEREIVQFNGELCRSLTMADCHNNSGQHGRVIAKHRKDIQDARGGYMPHFYFEVEVSSPEEPGRFFTTSVIIDSTVVDAASY
jgi:hypothetical protein